MRSTPDISFALEEQLPLRPPGAGLTARSFKEVGAVLLAIFALTVVLFSGTYVFYRVFSGKRRRKGRPRSSRIRD